MHKLISLLLLCHTLSAQDITLSGVLPSAGGKDLELTNLFEQKWTIPADAEGKFKRTFSDIPEGYYNLTEIGSVYLKPGYSLVISRNDEKVSMKGKGSAENNMLQEMRVAPNKMREDLQNGKYNLTTIPEFAKTLQDFRAGQVKMLEQQKLDPAFVALRKADLDFTVRNLWREYQNNYGIDAKKRENFYSMLDKFIATKDYAGMDSARQEMELKKMTAAEKKTVDSLVDSGADFNNEQYYRGSMAYRRWMEHAMQLLMYTKYREDFSAGMGKDKLNAKIIENEVFNPFVKDHLKYQNTSVALKMSSDLQVADSIYNAYGQSNSNKTYAALIDGTYKKIKRFSKGAPAPEFSYYSVSGEKVSLSSLAGNVVYIDVWATWCGPCKAEIPHLQKVEEEFRDKKIKFVSISVDEPRDKDKWKNFVNEKQMKGIQLITENAFSSDFIKDFNIVAIPRFILIDGEGKIVSANAKRPSNKLLREELEKLL